MSEISVKSEGIGIPKNQVETLKPIEPVMFDTHFIPCLIILWKKMVFIIIILYSIIYISVSPWLLNYLMWPTQFMCLYDFGQLYFHSHTQDNQSCSSAALWVSDPWGDTSGLGPGSGLLRHGLGIAKPGFWKDSIESGDCDKAEGKHFFLAHLANHSDWYT